jgi:hypothetical protein
MSRDVRWGDCCRVAGGGDAVGSAAPAAAARSVCVAAQAQATVLEQPQASSSSRVPGPRAVVALLDVAMNVVVPRQATPVVSVLPTGSSVSFAGSTTDTALRRVVGTSTPGMGASRRHGSLDVALERHGLREPTETSLTLPA